jgi:hypothetical protein
MKACKQSSKGLRRVEYCSSLWRLCCCPVFKDEAKKHINISDEKIERTLLDLDDKEII